MMHPLILKCASKQTCINFPKREELSLRTVLALPENNHYLFNIPYQSAKVRIYLITASFEQSNKYQTKKAGSITFL